MNSADSAKDSLLELVKHVLAHQGESLAGITYEKLASRIGRLNKHGVGHGHGMAAVLGNMGRLLRNLGTEWGERIPHIQCLVVRKTGINQGLPDDGIKEFWQDYPRLTLAEKRAMAQAERNKVAQFGSRWNRVLQQLGLPPVEANPKAVAGQFGAGGESPQHKALKEYVRCRPDLVGVEDGADAFTEYALPSLDTVDVLFKTEKCWTGIEVKSVVSEGVAGDFERGIYQVVKYSAILEAMKRDEDFRVPEKIKVILVLEGMLPFNLRTLAARLFVKVIERVKPTQAVVGPDPGHMRASDCCLSFSGLSPQSATSTVLTSDS